MMASGFMKTLSDPIIKDLLMSLLFRTTTIMKEKYKLFMICLFLLRSATLKIQEKTLKNKILLHSINGNNTVD